MINFFDNPILFMHATHMLKDVTDGETIQEYDKFQRESTTQKRVPVSAPGRNSCLFGFS